MKYYSFPKQIEKGCRLMSSTVMIKGNKSGIVLVLDKEVSFSDLKKEIAAKFQESTKFLGNTTMAISFDGRVLTTEEQKTVIQIIEENSDLKIACVVDHNKKQEEMFQKSLEEKLSELNTNSGQFYKGNLRSGQVLEMETSVVVIGDVNVGAKVISKGNIIIIGNLRGNAFAGAGGNKNAFILALGMEPIQIRIADFIARAPDKVGKGLFHEKSGFFGRKKDKKKLETSQPQEIKIAFVEGENIFIEPLSKDVLNELNI